MAVRSMLQIVSAQMEESLAERVPEDVDCIYDVSPVSLPDVCEEGHFHGVKSMVRLGIYVDWSDKKQRRAPVSTSVIIPHWWVSDGDTEPVREAVDHLWNDAVFANLMEPMGHRLTKVAEQEGQGDFLVDSPEEIEVDDDDE